MNNNFNKANELAPDKFYFTVKIEDTVVLTLHDQCYDCVLVADDCEQQLNCSKDTAFKILSDIKKYGYNNEIRCNDNGQYSFNLTRYGILNELRIVHVILLSRVVKKSVIEPTDSQENEERISSLEAAVEKLNRVMSEQNAKYDKELLGVIKKNKRLGCNLGAVQTKHQELKKSCSEMNVSHSRAIETKNKQIIDKDRTISELYGQIEMQADLLSKISITSTMRKF